MKSHCFYFWPVYVLEKIVLHNATSTRCGVALKCEVKMMTVALGQTNVFPNIILLSI